MSELGDSLQQCPCCGDLLGPRQINQHLQQAVGAMDLDAESDSDNNTNSFDLGVEPGDRHDNIPPPVEVDLTEFEDPIDQNAGATNDLEILNLDSDLDKQLGPDYPEIHGLNYDPEYIERDNVPRVDPDDKPALTKDEMRQALEFDYGNMLDNEFDNIYSCSLSDHDCRTLQFLAA
ncbi:hypothetical protein BN14_08449 [Rhizoctonia solani AG-1 IB]|uniref:Uncharacterized protein n=1 Tax=Thanatephorus cucumeris (strain AG1-IB / isolate 7/3/14) TaxID=1108050 RepID=M5C4K7_THACB|nr:hypothetical protein BN14_08449 [Rhizoctonia solani AG-1 IB]